jgi:lipoprotein-releasing system ATP-binding protein
MDEKTTIMESAPSNVELAVAGGEPRPLLFLHAISRRFGQGDGKLDILKSAELAVWPGQSVALIAPSGAGKSTLLHIAGLLEQPDAGEVYIDSVATSNLTDHQRTRIRRTDIGFVYQFHHLLPEFSAVENVMMPQMIRGLKKSEARTRASELLSYLGLKDRLTHRPAELSGGEPTGNLDQRTSERVFATMSQLVRASGLAAIIATHNLDIASQMDRRVTIREGTVVELG